MGMIEGSSIDYEEEMIRSAFAVIIILRKGGNKGNRENRPIRDFFLKDLNRFY
jgi:hypothetical protein